MTYIVSSGALNSTHSLIHINDYVPLFVIITTTQKNTEKTDNS